MFAAPLVALALALPPVAAAQLAPPRASAQPSTSEQLRERRTRANPKISALTMSALRRFAKGLDGGPLDEAIGKAFADVQNGPAIAKRIVDRIDALPASKRDAAFGKRRTDQKVTVAMLQSEAKPLAGSSMSAIGDTPPDMMPPQAASYPAQMTIELAGAQIVDPVEADGDELLVLASTIRVGTDGYVIDGAALPGTGVLTPGAGKAIAQEHALVAGDDDLAALVVSIAVEVDGSDAAVREEYTAMLALAEGLALQLGGTLDDFAFALDYTVGLLALDNPAWGAGALVKTPVSKSGTSLGELWLGAPATTGAVKWKLRHRHEHADGTYDVFFDVPNGNPGTTTLVVEVLSVEVLAGSEPGGDDLAVAIAIGDASLVKQLADDDDKHYPGWKVARIVSSDPTITVSLWDRSPPPAKYYDIFASKCVDNAGYFTTACPAGKTPVNLGVSAQSLKWDLETKKLTAGAAAKSGEQFVVFGDGPHPGRVKLRITQTTSAPRAAKATTAH